MQVTVKLFASLRDYLPPSAEGVAVREAAEHATVGDVLEELKIPVSETKIILLNSKHADRDQVLGDGDVLAAFPLVAGGFLAMLLEGLLDRLDPANNHGTNLANTVIGAVLAFAFTLL